jgi:type III secretory pathway component EscS
VKEVIEMSDKSVRPQRAVKTGQEQQDTYLVPAAFSAVRMLKDWLVMSSSSLERAIAYVGILISLVVAATTLKRHSLQRLGLLAVLALTGYLATGTLVRLATSEAVA